MAAPEGTVSLNDMKQDSARSSAYIEVSGVTETSTEDHGIPPAPSSYQAGQYDEQSTLLPKNYGAASGEGRAADGKRIFTPTGDPSCWGQFKDFVRKIKFKVWQGRIKTFILVVALIVSATAFGMNEEIEEGGGLHAVVQGGDLVLPRPTGPVTEVILDVSLAKPDEEYTLETYIRDKDQGIVGEPWTITVGDDTAGGHMTHKFFSGQAGDLEGAEVFFSTDSDTAIALEVHLLALSSQVEYEVIFAALILLFVYVLIVFELIHRALAAMVGAFIALATLSALGKQPSLEVIVGWIDFETVMLLFGMMIIVGILADTGVFEWSAVKAYKLSGGNVWRLVYILCFFTAVVSAFLDNVTTILLITPVTISMCRVIGLDPIPILLAEVLFSNIGGTATAVGDPPNVILVSTNWRVVRGEADIEFAEFTGHMALGIIFVMAASFGFLRILYRNVNLSSPDSPAVLELKREIFLWQRTRGRVFGNTPEEDVVRTLLSNKINALHSLVEEKAAEGHEEWQRSVQEMEEKNRIKDKNLLIDSSVVLTAVIIMFFVHSVPQIHLDLGWIAIIGAMALLLVADIHDLDHVLERVEWGTLMFFAALFILMEALAELGLIDWIGEGVGNLIKSVDEPYRLSVALLLILWVSAIASAFIDNIPFTTAMIPVVISIANDETVGLPLRPMVWALAFGTCLGGNGTLIGASANVVCAGMAEQEGIIISFNRFFKVGFPMMIATVTVATGYLLICHSVIGWDVPTN